MQFLISFSTQGTVQGRAKGLLSWGGIGEGGLGLADWAWPAWLGWLGLEGLAWLDWSG